MKARHIRVAHLSLHVIDDGRYTYMMNDWMTAICAHFHGLFDSDLFIKISVFSDAHHPLLEFTAFGIFRAKCRPQLEQTNSYYKSTSLHVFAFVFVSHSLSLFISFSLSLFRSRNNNWIYSHFFASTVCLCVCLHRNWRHARLISNLSEVNAAFWCCLSLSLSVPKPLFDMRKYACLPETKPVISYMNNTKI